MDFVNVKRTLKKNRGVHRFEALEFAPSSLMLWTPMQSDTVECRGSHRFAIEIKGSGLWSNRTGL